MFIFLLFYANGFEKHGFRRVSSHLTQKCISLASKLKSAVIFFCKKTTLLKAK